MPVSYTHLDQVVYISCDPQTQKRDLAVLRAGGYHVREIQPVDMFPQTDVYKRQGLPV